VITAIVNGALTDRYHSSGTLIQQQGWKVLDIQVKKKAATEAEGDQQLPSNLERGQAQDVLDAAGIRKKTRAPRRFTEATLLTAMETAGKTLDEKELSDAMKETGLGTPATRASIIEVLLKRNYIVREGKNLEATDKGIRLIEVVHPEVKSPIMTGHWEAHLKRIERGQAELAPFMRAIEDYVRWKTSSIVASASPPSEPTRKRSAAPSSKAATSSSSCPQARANPSATSCPVWPEAAQPSSSARSSRSWRTSSQSSAPGASPSNASTPAATAPPPARSASTTSPASCSSSSSPRSACGSRAFPRCLRSADHR
jgi:DNA topoisomerase-3